jgi:hypothetical protein
MYHAGSCECGIHARPMMLAMSWPETSKSRHSVAVSPALYRVPPCPLRPNAHRFSLPSFRSFRGYDEPKSLSYSIASDCPTCADGEHLRLLATPKSACAVGVLTGVESPHFLLFADCRRVQHQSFGCFDLVAMKHLRKRYRSISDWAAAGSRFSGAPRGPCPSHA